MKTFQSTHRICICDGSPWQPLAGNTVLNSNEEVICIQFVKSDITVRPFFPAEPFRITDFQPVIIHLKRHLHRCAFHFIVWPAVICIRSIGECCRGEVDSYNVQVRILRNRNVLYRNIYRWLNALQMSCYLLLGVVSYLLTNDLQLW